MPASSEKPLDIEVLKQFRVIIKSVRGHFQSIEESCGISGAQLWALDKIQNTDGITINELARELAVHQTTASNLVEKLHTKKLVKKLKRATDNRFVSLALTAAGEKILNKAPAPLQGLLPDALGRMPYKKLLALHELLDDLQKLMSAIDESAAGSPLSDEIEEIATTDVKIKNKTSK